MVNCESLVLWIAVALFDVEGQGDDFEEIASCELIVLFEVVEEGLFVAEVEIVSEMVVHPLPLVPYLLQL